jgi:hypothetical protein
MKNDMIEQQVQQQQSPIILFANDPIVRKVKFSSVDVHDLIVVISLMTTILVEGMEVVLMVYLGIDCCSHCCRHPRFDQY